MSLGLLGKFSEDGPLTILIYLITDLKTFLNVSERTDMTDEQIAQTANLILDDYECRNLKPEDYKVIFEGIKKGEYGKIFNRLDGQVIFEAIRAYGERRAVWVEENHYREHNHRKENDKTNLIAPQVVEMYKEILKNVKAEEEKPKPPPEPKRPREKTEREKLIQSLFREFYDKWKDNPYHPSDNNELIKFIKVGGKIYDEVSYTEFRLSQIEDD